MKVLSFQYDADSITLEDVLADISDYFGVNVTAGAATTIPQSLQTPATPAMPAAGTPPTQTDSTGLPWDKRIHSQPPKLTEKGIWRAKRGATPQLVAQVEAELRHIAALPAAQAPQTPASSQAPAAQSGEPPIVQFPVGSPDYTNAMKAYAHSIALGIAGPQMVDEQTLNEYLYGSGARSWTFGPGVTEWLSAYVAARGDAINQFRKVNEAVQNLIPQAPQAPAVPTPPAAPPAAAISNVPTPPAAPPAGPTSTDAALSFPALMQWIVANQMAGRITPEVVANTCMQLGIVGVDGKGSIAAVSQRMDFASVVVAMLQSQGAM